MTWKELDALCDGKAAYQRLLAFSPCLIMPDYWWDNLRSESKTYWLEKLGFRRIAVTLNHLGTTPVPRIGDFPADLD